MLDVFEAVKNIKKMWDVTPYGSGVHKAIDAALLACDEANERAEAAGAEWTRARDAFNRRGDPSPVEREAAWCIVEEYFGRKP
jgi:hypothetical protein